MAKSSAASRGDRHQSHGKGQHIHTISSVRTELTRWWMPFFKESRCWALSVVALAVLVYYEWRQPSTRHLRLETSWHKSNIELTRSHIVLAAAAPSGREDKAEISLGKDITGSAENVGNTAMNGNRTAERTDDSTEEGEGTMPQSTALSASRESTLIPTSTHMGLMEENGVRQQQQQLFADPPFVFDTHRGNADRTQHKSVKDASKRCPWGLRNLERRTASTSSKSEVDDGEWLEERTRSFLQTPSSEGRTGGAQESGGTTSHPTRPEEEKQRADALQMNAFTEIMRSMRPYTRGFAVAVQQDASQLFSLGETPQPQATMERALRYMEELRLASKKWNVAWRGRPRRSTGLPGRKKGKNRTEDGSECGNENGTEIPCGTQTSREASFTTENVTATLDQQAAAAGLLSEQSSAAPRAKQYRRKKLSTTVQRRLSAPEGASASKTAGKRRATGDPGASSESQVALRTPGTKRKRRQRSVSPSWRRTSTNSEVVRSKGRYGHAGEGTHGDTSDGREGFSWEFREGMNSVESCATVEQKHGEGVVLNANSPGGASCSNATQSEGGQMTTPKSITRECTRRPQRKRSVKLLEAFQQESVSSTPPCKGKQRQSGGKQKKTSKAVGVPRGKKGTQQKGELSGRARANKGGRQFLKSRVLRFPRTTLRLLQQHASMSSPSAREVTVQVLDRQRERHQMQTATLKLLARRFARRLKRLQHLDQQMYRRRQPPASPSTSNTSGRSGSRSDSRGSRSRSGTASRCKRTRKPVTLPGVDEVPRDTPQQEAQLSASKSARARGRTGASQQPSDIQWHVSPHSGKGAPKVRWRRVHKKEQQAQQWEQGSETSLTQVQQVKTARKQKTRTQTASGHSIALPASTSSFVSYMAPSRGALSGYRLPVVRLRRHIVASEPVQQITVQDAYQPDSQEDSKSMDCLGEQCREQLQQEVSDTQTDELVAELEENLAASAGLHTSYPFPVSSPRVSSELAVPHPNATSPATSNQLGASTMPSHRGASTTMEAPLQAQLQQQPLLIQEERLVAEVQQLPEDKSYAGTSPHMQFLLSPFSETPEPEVPDNLPSPQLEQGPTAFQGEGSINREPDDVPHDGNPPQSSALPQPLPSRTQSMYYSPVPTSHHPGSSYDNLQLPQNTPLHSPGPFQMQYQHVDEIDRQPTGAVVPPSTVSPVIHSHRLTHAPQQLLAANPEGGVSSQGPFVQAITHVLPHPWSQGPDAQLQQMLMTPSSTHPQTVQPQEEASEIDWRILIERLLTADNRIDDGLFSGNLKGSHITGEGESTTGQQENEVHSATWTPPESGRAHLSQRSSDVAAHGLTIQSTSDMHRRGCGSSSSSTSSSTISVASPASHWPPSCSSSIQYTSTESQHAAESGPSGIPCEQDLSLSRPLHATVQTPVTLEWRLATPAEPQSTVTRPLTDPLKGHFTSTAPSVHAPENWPNLRQLDVDPPRSPYPWTKALQVLALLPNTACQQPSSLPPTSASSSSSSSSSSSLTVSESPSTIPQAATFGNDSETIANSQLFLVLPFHEDQRQSAHPPQAPPRRLQQQQLNEEAGAEEGARAEEIQRLLTSYAQHKEQLNELEDEVVASGIPFLRRLNPDLRNSPLAAANINTEEEAKLDRVDDGLTETQMLRKSVSCFRTVEAHFTARRQKYISLVNREGPTLGMREDEALRLLFYGTWVACYSNAKEQLLDQLLAGRLTDEEQLLLLRRTAETPFRFSRRQHLVTEEVIRKFAVSGELKPRLISSVKEALKSTDAGTRQYPADDAKVNGTIGVIYSMLIVGCLFVSLLLLHRIYSARRRSRSSDVKQETSVIRLQSDVELSHRRPRSAVGIETSTCVS